MGDTTTFNPAAGMSAKLLLAVCAAAALLQGASLSMQTGSAHQLTITRPDDPGFDSLLGANYPGLSSAAAYSVMRPHLVLLENNTFADAKAYAIEWTLTYSDGAISRFSQQFIQKHYMPVPAARVLHTSEMRLVSPVFSLTPAEYRSMTQFDVAFPPGRFVRVQNATVRAELDAVVYSDNVFVGPDHTHLEDTYICTRHAEHDEGALVKHLFSGNKSVSDILSALDADVKTGLRAHGPEPGGLYAHARGQEAQSLLNLYRQKGLQALKARAEKMARYPREHLVTASTE